MTDSAIFQIEAEAVAPRLLGLLDRRAAEPTAGCFDRPYWRYKTADFPSAWFQNATEYLAYLAIAGEGRWRGAAIHDWAGLALNYSLGLVASDGSVAEAYPFERGYCASAFLAAHLAATTRLLDLTPDRRLLGMADFLCRPKQPVPANQLAAAALALFRLARLFDDAALATEAARRLEEVWAAQAPGGGFWEYGPGDVGYQTVTLSLLAQMDAEGYAGLPGSVLDEALQFVVDRVGPDGLFDYRATSRKTQYLYPYGLAYFRSPALAALRRGLADGLAMRPSWFDDRYVADIATDYFRTAILMRERPS